MTSSYLSDCQKRARINSDRGASYGRSLSRKASGGSMEQLFAGRGAGAGDALGIVSGSRERISLDYNYFRDWVYTAITAISRRLGSLSYGAGTLESADPQGKQFRGSKSHRTRFPKSVKQHLGRGKNVEPLENHPALEFLQQPNPVQDKMNFLMCMVANLYITGEAYWVGGDVLAGDQSTRETWMIPTPWITPQHQGKLFSSYVVKPPGNAGMGDVLPPEAVYRMYFPDPSNLKSCISPLLTQLRAVETDESIQSSQAQMFKQGIFPNVIVEMADVRDAEGRKVGPPALTGAQRRQLMKGIREISRDSIRNGDPFIVDAVIGGVHKLNAMPAEMDWLQSGEQVKKRIFQAFGVNPFITGESVPGSYAQAYVVDKGFCDNVINPLADATTVCLNSFIAPMFAAEAAQPKKLVLWLEEARPRNDELELRKSQAARTDGTISRNEFRSLLGLPPDDKDASDLTGLASTAAGQQAIISLLQQVGSGTIDPDSAVSLLVNIYGLDEDIAAEIVGDGPMDSLPIRPGLIPGQVPAASQVDDGSDSGAGGSNEPVGNAGKAIKSAIAKITRGQVKASHRREQRRLEREVAKSLRPFFGRSTLRQLRSLQGTDT